MIKNIIFDVGMVLVHFNWQDTFRKLGFDGRVYEAVADATVRSDMWNEYDRSSLSDEEILAGLIANAPGYEKQIRLVWDHLGDMIQCYPYTKSWLKELKDKGYQRYILSNYPRRTFELTRKELSFADDMDGGIFSYEVKLIKPEPEIFRALMKKYRLDPAECVFLDDNKANIQAAEALGIKGIQFRTKDQAVAELQNIGVS